MPLTPLFYIRTSPEVIPIPEFVEPHSIKVRLFSTPSLEEVLGKRTVVSLIIAGIVIQTRVIVSGDQLNYSAPLYDNISSPSGVIYVKPSGNNRKLQLLQSLNSPDYEVLEGESPTIIQGQRTVIIHDDIFLRLPVREIEKQYPIVFSTHKTILSPSIASFYNFGELSVESYISIPETYYSSFSSQVAPTMRLTSLASPDQWQQPIKMSSGGWTVIGVLWGIIIVSGLLSILVGYGWYITHYL